MAIYSWLDKHSNYIAALLLACVILSYLFPPFYIVSPLRNIPGPGYSRFTNLPLKLAVIRGRRLYHIHNLHKVHGPVVRISPNEVSIADADAFRTIHRAGAEFRKSDFYARFVNQPVPAMLDMSNPKQHAARRKLFARPFQKSELRTRWESMIRSKAELAMHKISIDMAQGKADILKWLFFMATDVTTHLLFGASMQMLENGRDNQYSDTIQVARGGAITAELPWIGFISSMLRLPIPLFRSKDIIFMFGQLTMSLTKGPDSDRTSIFAQLMNDPDSKENKSHCLSDLDMATEAGSFTIAGTGPGFAVTYLIWAVLRQPTVRCELEAEVGKLDSEFRDADLEKLRLLNAVINETMRMYGVVSGSIPRIVPQGGLEVGTHFIPQGAIVSTQSWTLHRDKELWPDPDEFKPSRWLADTALDSEKAIFAPFGTGSRMCLGIHLAMMEIRIATALFFRRFKGVRLAPETAAQELEFENFFLVKPKASACFVMADS